MTDLETAVLDVLQKALPSAMTLTDIHAKLIGRGWDVYAIIPQRITNALIALEDIELVKSELAWIALSDNRKSSLP